MRQDCEQCNGAGLLVDGYEKKPCEPCGGTGKIEMEVESEEAPRTPTLADCVAQLEFGFTQMQRARDELLSLVMQLYRLRYLQRVPPQVRTPAQLTEMLSIQEHTDRAINEIYQSLERRAARRAAQAEQHIEETPVSDVKLVN